MKGVTGLIIALTLAISGGICNWMYIARQADGYERVSFVKVDADQIRVGDRFKREHFGKVDIPKNNLGNLETVAVKWIDLSTVINRVASKNYVRDQIILQDDLTTPASGDLNKKIGPDERVMWLPVDPRGFNPQHVNPGDMVSFRVPKLLTGGPTPVASDEGDEPASDEIIGPFRILALGNRKGDPQIGKAYGQRFGSENVLAISVKVRGTSLEPRAQRILDVLATTNFKGVQVLLHPSTKSE